MKRHAPSVKVLMYEGWNKLKLAQQPTFIAKAKATKTKTSGSRKAGGAAAASASARTSRSTSASDTTSASASNSRSKRKAPDYDDDNNEPGPTLDESAQTSWRTFVQQFDVVLTTYQTLQSELVVARKPLKRPRREGATYVNTLRPRSPLVLVEYVLIFLFGLTRVVNLSCLQVQPCHYG